MCHCMRLYIIFSIIFNKQDSREIGRKLLLSDLEINTINASIGREKILPRRCCCLFLREGLGVHKEVKK